MSDWEAHLLSLGHCDTPETMADTENAIEKLAEQAKIAQVSCIPDFVQ
jgi:hypothetical protein